MVDWTKFFYVLIIAVIYVPMVFLGANVFFPKYTGTDSYYQYKNCPYDDCYQKFQYKAGISDTERAALDIQVAACQKTASAASEQCNKENNDAQVIWQKEKNQYESWKFVLVVSFSLVVLLIAAFLIMSDSVMMGLFLGSVVSTLISTIQYFYTNSKIAFAVLVVLFAFMLVFISKRKGNFLGKKKK